MKSEGRKLKTDYPKEQTTAKLILLS